MPSSRLPRAPARGGARDAQRERAAVTRAALVATARKLFAESGFHATGTNEIVARAAVTRGALYYHFADKEDLFAEVFRCVAAELVAKSNASVAGLSGDLWSKVSAAFRAYLHLVASEPEYQRILLIDGPVVLGWVLLIAGVAGLIASLRTQSAPGFLWALASALWAIAVGGYLLFRPLQGLATLTYVMIAFFVVDGLLMMVFAISHRREMSGKWEFLFINGLVDLVLAAIVISGLPGTLAWALGLLVGIDLLFGGWSLIAMALEARKRG